MGTNEIRATEIHSLDIYTRTALIRITVIVLAVFLLSSVSGRNNIVMAVQLSQTELKLTVGQTSQLRLKGAVSIIVWSSSREAVATVEDGTVTAKKAGTTYITAVSCETSYTCTVTVEKPKLNKSNLKLKVGKSYTLKLTGTTFPVTWKTTDKDIVSIKISEDYSCKIVANSVGTARIVAKVNNKNYKCKVTVKKSSSSVKLQPVVAEYGYTAYTEDDSSYNYVNVIARVLNPNSSYVIFYPCVQIRVYNTNGKLISKAYEIASYCSAGDSVYIIADFCISKKKGNIGKVRVSRVALTSYYFSYQKKTGSQYLRASQYKISGVSRSIGEYFCTYSGKLSKKTSISEWASPTVVVTFRKDGRLTGGAELLMKSIGSFKIVVDRELVDAMDANKYKIVVSW